MNDKQAEDAIEHVLGVSMVISFWLVGGLGGWWLMGGPILGYLLYGSGAFVGLTTATWAMYILIKS